MIYRLLFICICCFSAVFKLQATEALVSAPLLKKSLYYLDRDLDKAEDIIVKALEEAPEDAEVNFVCGRIMGKQAENTIIYALSYAKKSLSCLRKAVKLEPSEIRYKLGLLNFYLGAPSIAGGDVNLAHEQVAAISTVDEMQGAKAKVKFLMATEQNKKLKAYLMSARKKYPDDAEFHFRSGLLSQQNKMYEQAYEAFKAAIQTHEASSHYLNAMYQLGRNAVLSNLYIEEGAEMLQIYIKIHNNKNDIPPVSWAYLRLAQLYSLLNKQTMKEKYYHLAYQSSDRELHRTLKTLKKGIGR